MTAENGRNNGKEGGCHCSGDKVSNPPSSSNHPEDKSNDDEEEMAPIYGKMQATPRPGSRPRIGVEKESQDLWMQILWKSPQGCVIWLWKPTALFIYLLFIFDP